MVFILENPLVARCVVGWIGRAWLARFSNPSQPTTTNPANQEPHNTSSQPRISFWCEMRRCVWSYTTRDEFNCAVLLFCFVIAIDTGPRRPLRLEFSDTKVYEPKVRARLGHGTLPSQREFFIYNLLIRIHFIIVMIRWTGLAPWEFEFPFPGSLTYIYLKFESNKEEEEGFLTRSCVDV